MATTWTEESIGDSTWGFNGPLIYLATEGDRDLIMTECRIDYIVICKPGDWTEVSLGSATWAESNIGAATWGEESIPATSWTESVIE